MATAPNFSDIEGIENLASEDADEQQEERYLEENGEYWSSIIADATSGNGEQLKRRIEEDLDKWKDVKINIAFIGSSGTGKSSLINAMRNVTADDPEGADVGGVETTTTPTPYPHPLYSNLILWDLPGIGTTAFPRETYLKNVDENRYDFFVLVSGNRFTEDDLLLAKEIQKKKRKFFFVRTMIDSTLSSLKNAKPRTFQEGNEMEKIRKYNVDHIKNAGISSPFVFLIDNYNAQRYDFENFVIQLIQDAPSLKTDALILTFPAFSKTVIKKKKAVLSKRKWVVALASAGASAVPVPGAGLAVELGMIYREANLYCEQLGIDRRSVERLSETFGFSKDAVIDKCSLQMIALLINPGRLLSYIGFIGISEGVETSTKIAFPIIGNIISAIVSYPISVYTLKVLLDKCEGEALTVNGMLKEWKEGKGLSVD